MLNVVKLSAAIRMSNVILNDVMLSIMTPKILNEIISPSSFEGRMSIDQRLLTKTENELA
jgi:hypothetical protein